MNTEISTLRDFVVAKLDERHMSQTALALASGLSISDINGIVQGRIKLPGASKRRLLAHALGVSHLDILIAAGEITEDEIEATGRQGIKPTDPVRAELMDRLARIPMTPINVRVLTHALDFGFDPESPDHINEARGSIEDGVVT